MKRYVLHVNLDFNLIVWILTTIFVALKITGYLQWSWVWVLAPLWVLASIFIFVILVYIIRDVWSGKLR